MVFKDSKDAGEIYEKCVETLSHKDGVSKGENKGLSYIFERDEKNKSISDRQPEKTPVVFV